MAADVQSTPSHGPAMHGVKGFMTTETAGMPNWVWLLVIVAGVAAAVIIPKLLQGKTANNGGNATTTGTTPDSGLGLAIDPTTGLPYAVEGLVPSGGTVGTPPPPTPPPPTPTPSGVPGKDYGLIPFGQYNGPSYSNLKPGTHYTYNGTTYTLKAGDQGRLWGVDGSGKQVLLYEPQSFYPGGANYHGPGGGGPNVTTVVPAWPGDTMQVRMR